MNNATLAVIQNNRHCSAYSVDKPELTVGRQNCDITILDEQASRLHAKIVRLPGGKCRIVDQKSRNGTFVNGNKISEAFLSDEDRIAIGSTLLVFHDGNDYCESRKIASPTYAGSGIALDALKKSVFAFGIDDAHHLKRAGRDLSVLYRAGQTIHAILDTNGLYEAVPAFIVREFPNVDHCSLHVMPSDVEGAEPLCMASASRQASDAGRKVYSSSLIEATIREMRALLVFDTATDRRIEGAMSIDTLRIASAVCVPLQSKKRLIGVLQASSVRSDARLEEDDLKLLTAIGFLSGTAIENAALLETVAAEKRALEDANRKLVAAREGLIRSEKLAAVGQLAAGIVHDIKNPLLVIAGHTELLLSDIEEGVPAPEAIRMSLTEIREGVKHCGEIVNQLLQFARQSKPEKEMKDINALLSDTIKFLQYEIRKHRASLETEFHSGELQAEIDANQIKQVIINVVINALQALREDRKGIIRIVTGPHAGRKGFLSIRIEDNGQGMSEEIKQKLFDPFFSTKTAEDNKAGGTGLGLSVCHGIVESHGGSIEVESEPEKGSAFTIFLPTRTNATCG
jgi:signal transduction histidine kinase